MRPGKKDKIKSIRKDPRISTDLDATYIVNSTTGGYCKLTNISLNGIGIVLNSKKKFNIGTKLNMEINIPEIKEPIRALVTLTWIEELKEKIRFSYKAGGDMIIKNNEDKKLFFKCVSKAIVDKK